MKLKKLNLLTKIQTSNAGMTLMEIILVFSLLAVLGTLLARNLIPMLGTGKTKSAQIQLSNLQQDLDRYYFDCGRYPSTGQGLSALIKAPSEPPECKNYNPGGYLTSSKSGKEPTDPWGYPFSYTCDDGANYEIKSLGADGKEGGDGQDADISSKE